MAQKKETKKIKVRDLKPRKDAKGGVAGADTHGANTHGVQGKQVQGHIMFGPNQGK
jgi:hypothetical protein